MEKKVARPSTTAVEKHFAQSALTATFLIYAWDQAMRLPAFTEKTTSTLLT